MILKFILYKICLIFILAALPLPAKAMLCPVTQAGDAISRQAAQWTENFLKRDDKYDILAAQVVGFGAEAGAFYLGNKYAPLRGIVKFRNMTIPAKTVFAGCVAKFAGYTSPVGTYLYLQAKKENSDPFLKTKEILHRSVDTRFRPDNMQGEIS